MSNQTELAHYESHSSFHPLRFRCRSLRGSPGRTGASAGRLVRLQGSPVRGGPVSAMERHPLLRAADEPAFPPLEERRKLAGLRRRQCKSGRIRSLRGLSRRHARRLGIFRCRPAELRRFHRRCADLAWRAPCRKQRRRALRQPGQRPPLLRRSRLHFHCGRAVRPAFERRSLLRGYRDRRPAAAFQVLPAMSRAPWGSDRPTGCVPERAVRRRLICQIADV